MRPPLNWLLRLYPRAWRERYGHEFEALVDDTGRPWHHATDIFLEAMRLRLAAQNWRVVAAFALAISLSVTLAITDAVLKIGLFPVPYTSVATLEFPSPAVREAYLKRQTTLTVGLLESVHGDGAWYRTEIRPVGQTQARMTVRYSNRFKAQVMAQNLAARIPEAKVYEPASLPSDGPIQVYGPGIALLLLTGLLLLLNRRKLTRQTV